MISLQLRYNLYKIKSVEIRKMNEAGYNMYNVMISSLRYHFDRCHSMSLVQVMLVKKTSRLAEDLIWGVSLCGFRTSYKGQKLEHFFEEKNSINVQVSQLRYQFLI